MSGHLIINASNCIGCRTCMLTCSFEHEGIYSFFRSRIMISHENPEKEVFKPRVCVQCEEKPCIDSCSEDALCEDNVTGAIKIDEEKCIGCGNCIESCPHDGILYDEKTKLPLICDLCGGNPACVKFCELTQAILYVSG